MISLHYPSDRVTRFRCANTIIYIQGIPGSYGYRSLEIIYQIKDIQVPTDIPQINCSCGAASESAEHYFFECPLYTEARDRLFQSLNLGIDININFQLLTSGSQHFDNETNRSILLSVLRFLKDSHRFD